MSNLAAVNNSDSGRILYIDIGNTAIKVSYREDGEWVEPVVFPHDEDNDFLEWISETRHQFEYIVVASVVDRVKKAVTEGLGSKKNISLTINDVPQDRLNYETIGTLGIDRFLACYGAYSRAEKPVVVIDAGSACTIDCMSGEGIFQGGIIMPGLAALEKGLTRFAPNLPHVEKEIPGEWPGRTTMECLQWGISGVFADAVTAALERYSRKFKEYELFLTGGDADWVEKYVAEDGIRDPLLIFRGMHALLSDSR